MTVLEGALRFFVYTIIGLFLVYTFAIIIIALSRTTQEIANAFRVPPETYYSSTADAALSAIWYVVPIAFVALLLIYFIWVKKR